MVQKESDLVKYMDRIYSLIGKIIENAQYIEFNLATLVKCDYILKEFDHTSELSLSRYNQIVEEAIQTSNELTHKTLGEIIFQIKAINRLDNEEIACLEKVLKTRNYLIHQYFKKNDFSKEASNEAFLLKEINYLTNIFSSMYNLNTSLARIIEYEQKELAQIK